MRNAPILSNESQRNVTPVYVTGQGLYAVGHTPGRPSIAMPAPLEAPQPTPDIRPTHVEMCRLVDMHCRGKAFWFNAFVGTWMIVGIGVLLIWACKGGK